MAKLDFSGINKIAYQGFEDQEARDSLLDQGFVVVNDENPFPAPQEADTSVSGQRTADTRTKDKSPSERLKKAFTDKSGRRDYNILYRVAHDFHKTHTPPVVDRDYWKDHRPGEDDTPQAEVDYWTQAAKDVAGITSAHGGDPFLTGLLVAVYEELEREYKELRDGSKAPVQAEQG